MIPFQKIKSPTTDLNKVQTNIALFSESLVNIPFLDGVLLEDLVLTTAEQKISHKLGRAYRGWILVRKNAAQDLYESSVTFPNQFISLTATGTVTVSLWVF